MFQSLPLEYLTADIFGDVVDINVSESQVSGERLLPVQHVVGYLTQVLVHSLMAVIQLQLQVRAGTGREGRHVP